MKPVGAPGAPLSKVLAGDPLVAAWFRGAGDGPGATAELAACLGAAAAPGPAPWFAGPAATAWAQELAAELADETDRARLTENLTALREGRAEVVVTGQQPGFLGGPLHTLHKIAAAVALARRLTAAGRRTVPVFWSGDDDDDLAESLAPVAARPDRDGLVRADGAGRAPRARADRRIVGRLPVNAGQAGGAAWLASLPAAGDGVGSPAADWAEALAGGWTWARLQRRALLRTFTGTGLLIVSGDDDRLHEAAAPLYERIRAAGKVLTAAAADRGRDLVAAGWHAQIGQASLARPLFVAEDGRRRPPAADEMPPPGRWRPGVMLRSPVQDWLLRPAAVVVGPAEYAYLRQLTTVYAQLGIARSPLVPRLYAWLLPEGFDRTLLARHRAGALHRDPEIGAALDAWEVDARRRLQTLLRDDCGLPSDRSEALTQGRLRRWRRGLDAALRGELAARRRAAVPTRPSWVFPDGGRQERRLAWAAARAVIGPGLGPALVDTADRHLAHGLDGDWREWELTLTNPEQDDV